MKEKFYVMLNQVVLMFGSLLVLKMLTNYLSINQFGIYSLILSLLALVSILPFNSFSQSYIRLFSFYHRKRSVSEFIYVARKWFMTFTLLYAVLTMSIIFIFSSDYDWKLVLISYIFFMTEVLKTTLRGIINSSRNRKDVVLSSLIEIILKLFLIYIINIFYILNIYLVVFIFITSNVFSIFPLRLNVPKKPIKKFESIIEKRIVSFSLPLIVWGGFGWARDMSNRWYLEQFVDTSSVAIFTVLASVALILPTAIQSLVNAYYIPILYEKVNDKTTSISDFFDKFAIRYIFVFFILFFILKLYSKEIISLFASSEYTFYSAFLPWMMIAYSLYVLSSIMALEIFAAKKTSYLLIPNIVPGVISILLGYFMINTYGLNGALYSYLATYLLYAILMFICVYSFRKRLGFEKIIKKN